MVAKILARHADTAVLSPGSRNAPLLVALNRGEWEKKDRRIVIDERSAGFIALGISIAEGYKPVALVCTSGTAPLNYGPAVAEAFYRHVPLIVITADRPEEWIDQDDSQTINQPGIFQNFIKGSYDIPVESDDANRMWMIERRLNDALLLAESYPPGPVHINIRIDEPLGEIIDIEEDEPCRIVESKGVEVLENINLADLEIGSKPTMIVCGFSYGEPIMEPLRKLAKLPNVIVLHEAQSNVHGQPGFIPNIDATLKSLPAEVIEPEVVISMGGSLTSRILKQYLRGIDGVKHISIGMSKNAVDCFKKLALRIQIPEYKAIGSLSEQALFGGEINFKEQWENASEQGRNRASEYAEAVPWSDFKAFSYLIPNIPEGWNLQLSNGTSVRYAQLFDYSKIGNIQCNRGVSGIDGCTSTAIGFAAQSSLPTILITGDMSMQYDIGALATSFIPKDFKIIAINNGGGGIFRFIPSTRNLDELERCFVGDVRLPLKELAQAYGMNYFCAESFDELREEFPKMLISNNSPSILEVWTDGELSGEILRNFFK